MIEEFVTDNKDIIEEDFFTCKNRLQTEVNQGSPRPKPIPNQLTLAQLRLAPAAFQPRDMQEDPLKSEVHVNALAEALRNGSAFDPLLIWWSGKHWYVIDGHHRLKAYRAIKWPEPKPVPVAVFDGTLYEAIAEASARNAKDKLPMTKADKLERAWKLVCLGELSKLRIHQATTVGTSTVANMRRERQRLIHTGEDPTKWAWTDVKNGERKVFDDRDITAKRTINTWSKRLYKALGTKPVNYDNYELLAEAIYKTWPGLPEKLLSYWMRQGLNLYARQILDDEDNPEF